MGSLCGPAEPGDVSDAGSSPSGRSRSSSARRVLTSIATGIETTGHPRHNQRPTTTPPRAACTDRETASAVAIRRKVRKVTRALGRARGAGNSARLTAHPAAVRATLQSVAVGAIPARLGGWHTAVELAALLGGTANPAVSARAPHRAGALAAHLTVPSALAVDRAVRADLGDAPFLDPGARDIAALTAASLAAGRARAQGHAVVGARHPAPTVALRTAESAVPDGGTAAMLARGSEGTEAGTFVGGVEAGPSLDAGGARDEPQPREDGAPVRPDGSSSPHGPTVARGPRTRDFPADLESEGPGPSPVPDRRPRTTTSGDGARTRAYIRRQQDGPRTEDDLMHPPRTPAPRQSARRPPPPRARSRR